ncbi:hypothetical protein A4S05_05520 [Nostoc sp. KVJ20]|nr:hypothetical protein A4S05_05520 [Nostoc sp. KVJ20]
MCSQGTYSSQNLIETKRQRGLLPLGAISAWYLLNSWSAIAISKFSWLLTIEYQADKCYSLKFKIKIMILTCKNSLKLVILKERSNVKTVIISN